MPLAHCAGNSARIRVAVEVSKSKNHLLDILADLEGPVPDRWPERTSCRSHSPVSGCRASSAPPARGESPRATSTEMASAAAAGGVMGRPSDIPDRPTIVFQAYFGPSGVKLKLARRLPGPYRGRRRQVQSRVAHVQVWSGSIWRGFPTAPGCRSGASARRSLAAIADSDVLIADSASHC
jgi:hypothetical protein